MSTSATLPIVDFKNLTDEAIANYGMDAGAALFAWLVSKGLVNGDSLALQVGCLDDEAIWWQFGRRFIGDDAHTFVGNIGSGDGKLAAALKYEKDSVEVYQIHGDVIPEGPMRYTGGVYFVGRVKTAKGWMERIFAGAASGVQGHFDQAVMYTVITTMVGIWACKMQALHGKG